MSIKEEITQALEIVEEMKSNSTNNETLRIVEDQLKQILDSILKTGDAQLVKKDEIILGMLAAREFEDWNPALADLLYSIDTWLFGERKLS